MIKVFLASLDNYEVDSTEIIRNSFINEHISKIKNTVYKNQSLIGFDLLDRIIFDLTKKHIYDEIICTNEFGKPYFKKLLFHFNISHSENAVVCAVSDSEVGIDIEKITTIKYLVLNKCFNESERHLITNNKDFYKLWTLKEAYFKYKGCGITTALTEIEFSTEDKIICKVKGEPQDLHFYYEIIDGYSVSVCTNNFDKIQIERH